MSIEPPIGRYVALSYIADITQGFPFTHNRISFDDVLETLDWTR